MSGAVDLAPLNKAMIDAADVFKSFAGKQLVHCTDHDADGIVSAYGIDIIADALAMKVERVFLDRPFENVIRHIYRNTQGPVIFTDHGGGHEDVIARVADGRDTFIIDHHKEGHTHHEMPPWLHCLNCNCYGVNGDAYACSSTLTYAFGKNITDNIREHAHLFLIGAVGDETHRHTRGQFHPDGIDALVMNDRDRAKFWYSENISHPNQRYCVMLPGRQSMQAHVVANLLTKVGCVRHKDSGGHTGLRILHDGPAMNRSLVDRCEEELGRRFESIRARLADGTLRGIATPNTFYFQVEDEFQDMTLKVIGDCARHLVLCARDEPASVPRLPRASYLLGAMPVPAFDIFGETVPAFEDRINRLKVSVRTTDDMRRRITIRNAPPVYELVEKFMPGSGNNSHDERGAGIIYRAASGIVPHLVEEYLDKYAQKKP